MKIIRESDSDTMSPFKIETHAKSQKAYKDTDIHTHTHPHTHTQSHTHMFLPTVALSSSMRRQVLLASVPMNASHFKEYSKFNNMDRYSVIHYITF
jgi:hypothetical protein